MAKSNKRKSRKLSTASCPPFLEALKNFSPPENLTVEQWADKYRILNPETSAEPGPWRTSRTPYLREPMAAFTDPKIHRIVIVAASQVGKSEFELNLLGYIMQQDPGSVLYIQPGEKDCKKFSRQRIAPMLRDTPALKGKVTDQKSRDGGNTILQKMFPGGSLTMAGSRSAPDLCSMPIRYIIADERDRWENSAGNEGDPWELAQARQITFYNRKAVEVSTPTIAGTSKIAASYELGTMERWQHKCPNCGEYNEITFDTIKHTREKVEINGKIKNIIKIQGHCCPDCGFIYTQEQMRKQPQRWHAENPAAYEQGVRSFWLTAFASPWQAWAGIFQKVYDNADNPEQLQVVYNTLLGQLWEERQSEVKADELAAHLETYPAELPDGALALTCGIDTQDDRLEYEVVAWGRNWENWGIKKGFISGEPDRQEVWEALDQILDKTYKFADGYGLKIALTFIDSGGHYTQEIYKRTKERLSKRVFAIKGRGGESIPLLSPAKKVPLKDNPAIKTWLYILGVDAGKAAIYSNLKVQTPGARYCHFNADPDAGYNDKFFSGLLSEKMERVRTPAGYKWKWVKLPGHARNEGLDCRNYAYCAAKVAIQDFDQLAQMLKTRRGQKKAAPNTRTAAPARSSRPKIQKDEW